MTRPDGSSTSVSALLASLAVIACLAPPVRAQEPVTVSLAAVADAAGLRLVLTPASAVATPPAVSEREVLVSFAEPVRVDVASDFNATAAGRVIAVLTGYDTLLVRVAQHVRIAVGESESGLEFRLTPAHPSSDDELAARRLVLLRAQWYAARGREAEALSTLTPLLTEAPADPQVLTVVGLTEKRIGWRRRAEATLRRAWTADGANPDLRALLDAIAAERAPRARVEFDNRRVGSDWHTWAERTEGSGPVGEALLIVGRLEAVQFDARQVRQADGHIGPMRRNLQRGEAWITYDTMGGTTWSASLFGAASGPGAGLTHSRPDAWGRWTMQGEVRRPFWEFVEGLASDGTRDRAAVERRQRLGPRADAWVAIAAHAYHVDPAGRASSWSLSGAVYVSVHEARPGVVLSYGFDKESTTSVTERLDASGTPYQPVPLTSREVHVPAVQVHHPIGPRLLLDAHAGYAFDRLGGRGPVAEGRLRWEHGRVRAEAFFEHRLHTLTATTAVTRAGGSLAVRLPARP